METGLRKRLASFLLTLVMVSPCAAGVERAPGEPSRTARAAPLQWKATGFPARRVARVSYPELQAATIAGLEKRNQAVSAGPLQIGIGRMLPGSRAAVPAIQWLVLADGSSLGRLEVTSPLAMGLRVGLQVKAMDARAEFRFAGSDNPARIVAMASGRQLMKRADAHGLYWTPLTDGQSQAIEIWLPPGVSRSALALQASQVSHLVANRSSHFTLAKGIGDSSACQIDTSCRVDTLGPDFVDAKNAVAQMTFVRDGASFLCTGTLLADSLASSQIPYFLTNGMCLLDQQAASTLNTFWGFEATSCGSGIARETVQLSSGAELLMEPRRADFPP